MNNASARMGESNVGYATRTIGDVDNSAFQIQRYAMRTLHNFSVMVSYRDIAAKNYSLSAGQYFDVKIEYVDITPEQFAEKMRVFTDNLESLFGQSRKLEVEIKKQLAGLTYEG